MFDMTRYVEVKRLLEEVARIEDRLTPNELEMARSLKAKYDEPADTAFDDKICLEVILRNVRIRAGYRLEPGDTAGRVIDLPRKGEPEGTD
jgi:hypothetical protein